MSTRLTLQEAQSRVLGGIENLGVERVELLQALNRVLAEEVCAPRQVPPRDNSGMDGYAVRYQDVQAARRDAPITLVVKESLPAGYFSRAGLADGEAIKIMTGAPMPAGADTVVRVEDTDGGDERVTIFKAPVFQENVRRSGEDIKRGELVLKRGSILRSAEIGLLASLGRSHLFVHRRPTVAILATGDEIADLGDPDSSGQILNSNSYTLAAQVINVGGVPVLLGVARDQREEIAERVQGGLRADCLVTSGGVSVGDFDYVREALLALGLEQEFWKVAIRPGGPIAFGHIGRCPVFSLPGNPVASMVTFELFVRPALLKMSGHHKLFRDTQRALLQESLPTRPGYTTYVRGILRSGSGGWTVTSTGPQGSGILRSMSLANCLIVIPADREGAGAGDWVEVIPLENQ